MSKHQLCICCERCCDMQPWITASFFVCVCFPLCFLHTVLEDDDDDDVLLLVHDMNEVRSTFAFMVHEACAYHYGMQMS